MSSCSEICHVDKPPPHHHPPPSARCSRTLTTSPLHVIRYGYVTYVWVGRSLGGGLRGGGRGGCARTPPPRLDALGHLPHRLFAQYVIELVEHRLDPLVLFELVLSAVG